MTNVKCTNHKVTKMTKETISSRRVRENWESIARDFPEDMVSGSTDVNAPKGRRQQFEFRHRVELSTFLAHVPISTNSNVLELGCGSGRWLVSLAPMVRTITGVDFCSGSLDVAKKRLENRSLKNVKLLNESVVTVDPGEKFDIIYTSGVLQYLNDEEFRHCLENISRMLLPGGILVSRDSLILFVDRYIKTGTYQCIYRNQNEFVSQVESCGYKMQWGDYAMGWDLVSFFWHRLPQSIQRRSAGYHEELLDLQERFPDALRTLATAKDYMKKYLKQRTYGHMMHTFQPVHSDRQAP
jgi:ubiquinone/menaquinone biosynthesis C-methylase UbiE